MDTALLELGQLLKERSYSFIQPSVADIKRHRRSPPAGSTVLDDLFGWGVPVAQGAIDGPLAAAMERAGVLEHDQLEAGITSRVRAASVAGQLCFHTSGPGAARDAVFIGPDTYSFIAALETALQAALKESPAPARILEVGCGSGAASIWLARRFPQAQVIGCDINPAALRLAELNRRLAGTGNLSFAFSDVASGVSGDFDLIVSNPPFIADSQERTYRNGGGLYGLELPLRIVSEAVGRLNQGGALLMFSASPVIDGRHVFTTELDARSIDHRLHELEAEAFLDSLDLPAYQGVERIASVLLSVDATE